MKKLFLVGGVLVSTLLVSGVVANAASSAGGALL